MLQVLKATRVDVLFGVFRDVSITNVERSKRECQSADGMKYKNILARYSTKSWTKFLSAASNKAELVEFLLG